MRNIIAISLVVCAILVLGFYGKSPTPVPSKEVQIL